MPVNNSHSWSSIQEAAIAALRVVKPSEKAAITHAIGTFWRSLSHDERLSFIGDASIAAPERPARELKPELLAPGRMPKRRKAGSLSSRIALLHAVAHIELNAINLAWDILARFAATLPRNEQIEFITDWISVAEDEARHFSLLSNRLKDLNSCYGDLPAHDGMWDSAIATNNNLLARLAIVPMVLEARGLDVTPQMIALFEKNGDEESAKVLNTIYTEEIRHVELGCKWFVRLTLSAPENPETIFHTLVKEHFKGSLKPPFNEKARNLAGLTKNFYYPLSA